MIGDPNWLYSTIAQSSAAIVAIVGGFITASVLMLTAEKRSLAQQQADKKTRLEALKSEKARLLDSHETIRVQNFFNTMRDVLTQEDGLPSLEELMQRHPDWDWDFNHEVLEREYSKLSKSRLEARQFIDLHSEKIDVTEDFTFDEWVAKHKLDISTYDYYILEDEYGRVGERKQEVFLEEKRASGALAWLPSPRTPRVHVGMSLWEQRELGSIMDRLRNVGDEIFLVEREIANLDARLSTFSYPPYLRLGASILLLFAFFSIVLPVSLILKEVFSPEIKQVTFLFFMAGLVAVIFYIALLIRELRRK